MRTPIDTEILERPSLTAEEAKAIAESQPGVELIPNLTPSPEVKFNEPAVLPVAKPTKRTRKDS